MPTAPHEVRLSAWGQISCLIPGGRWPRAWPRGMTCCSRDTAAWLLLEIREPEPQAVPPCGSLLRQEGGLRAAAVKRGADRFVGHALCRAGDQPARPDFRAPPQQVSGGARLLGQHAMD
jgi:hypothetical protein